MEDLNSHNEFNILKSVILIQTRYKQIKKKINKLNFDYQNLLNSIQFCSQQLNDNYIYNLISKKDYFDNLQKLENLCDSLDLIKYPYKFKDLLEQNINENIALIFYLKKQLSFLIKHLGTLNIIEALRLLYVNNLENTIEYSLFEEIKLFNKISNVVSANTYTSDEFKIKNKIIFEKLHDYYLVVDNFKTRDENLNDKFNISLNGINLYFNFDNFDRIIELNCYLRHDPLNLIHKNFMFKPKYKKILRKIKELVADNNYKETFEYKYFIQMSDRDFIVYNDIEILEEISSSKIELEKLKKINISNLVKKFIISNLIEQRRILTLFLISDEEDRLIAHLIYDMILNKSYLLNSQPLANEIYKSLHWSVQKIFNISLKNNTDTKLDDIEFNEDDIGYEKRIELLKADKSVKRKALDKLKETNGSKENSTKAQNYLDGLLKIPFGIYRKEPILNFLNNFKLKINKPIDCSYVEVHNFIKKDIYKYEKNEKDKIMKEWDIFTTKKETYMKDVSSILNNAIFGQQKAKDQIERFIAQWIHGKMDGCVFGFHGPPGTGKTTLCKNGLAKCLKDENGEPRPFAFIALGGSSNGSILEGHHYTYLGSTWGKIADLLMQSKCMNPIIYIDELDKVSQTEHGKEIVGIMTHLIDSSQNTEFSDKYFAGIKLDLSKAIFVFSYNDRNLIDPILRDRITEINIESLSKNEKIKIIQDYLLPEILENTGFNRSDILFSNELLEHIIDTYTFESGVRKLKEKIIEIIRDINYNIALSSNNKNTLQNNIDFSLFPIIITRKFVDNLFSEKPKIEYKKISKIPQIGLVNGLYATVTGLGGITIIEISKMLNDTKLALELTGQQGDVMKESMKCAKTVAWNLIPNEFKKKLNEEWKEFGNWGLHIHCPDGATPKDGPSAGCAITIGIISRICNIKINNTIALTGEIDLNGNVKKIGGLKAKIEGAKRAGVKLVLIPTENEQELRNYLSDYYYQKYFEKINKITFSIKIDKLIKIINPCIEIKLVSRIEEICKLIFIDTNIFDNLDNI